MKKTNLLWLCFLSVFFLINHKTIYSSEMSSSLSKNLLPSSQVMSAYKKNQEQKKIISSAKNIWELGFQSEEALLLNCPEIDFLRDHFLSDTLGVKNDFSCSPLLMHCFFLKNDKNNYIDGSFVKRASMRTTSHWVFSFFSEKTNERWALSFTDHCRLKKVPFGLFPTGVYNPGGPAFLWEIKSNQLFIEQELVTQFDFWFWQKINEVSSAHQLSHVFKELKILQKKDQLFFPLEITSLENTELAENYCWRQGKTLLTSFQLDAALFKPLPGEEDLPRWRGFFDMYTCDDNHCVDKLTYTGVSLSPRDWGEIVMNEKSGQVEVRPPEGELTFIWGQRLKFGKDQKKRGFRCSRLQWIN